MKTKKLTKKDFRGLPFFPVKTEIGLYDSGLPSCGFAKLMFQPAGGESVQIGSFGYNESGGPTDETFIDCAWKHYQEQKTSKKTMSLFGSRE